MFEKNSEKNHDTSQKKKSTKTIYEGVALTGLILQFFFMYFFSFWHKKGDSWNTGMATYFALNNDYLRLPFGDLLLQLPISVLIFATYSVLSWELLGGFLYFLPFQVCRILGCFGFILLHIGFGISLSLGMFTLTAVSGNLAFLPPLFWNFIHYFIPQNSLENFGIKVGDFLIQFLETLGFLDTQIVVQKKVSTYRSKFKKRSFKVLSATLCFIVIAICLHWNLEHSGFIDHGVKSSSSRFIQLPALPDWYKNFRVYMRLGQNWVMFSNVAQNVWWYVIDGTLMNGTHVDIWSDNGIFSWSHPHSLKSPEIALKEQPDLKGCIGGHRWWKFYERFNDGDERDHLRKGFSDIICREWNNRYRKEIQLKSFKIFWIKREVFVNGTRAPVSLPLELWSANCTNIQKYDDNQEKSHQHIEL